MAWTHGIDVGYDRNGDVKTARGCTQPSVSPCLATCKVVGQFDGWTSQHESRGRRQRIGMCAESRKAGVGARDHKSRKADAPRSRTHRRSACGRNATADCRRDAKARSCCVTSLSPVEAGAVPPTRRPGSPFPERATSTPGTSFPPAAGKHSGPPHRPGGTSLDFTVRTASMFEVWRGGPGDCRPAILFVTHPGALPGVGRGLGAVMPLPCGRRARHMAG